MLHLFCELNVNKMEGKYLKEGASFEDAFNYLLAEHLATRAHVDAQRALLTFVLTLLKAQGMPSIDEMSKGYQNLVRMNYDKLVEDHPLLEGMWKNQLKELLKDIPGIDMPI